MNLLAQPEKNRASQSCPKQNFVSLQNEYATDKQNLKIARNMH